MRRCFLNVINNNYIILKHENSIPRPCRLHVIYRNRNNIYYNFNASCCVKYYFSRQAMKNWYNMVGFLFIVKLQSYQNSRIKHGYYSIIISLWYITLLFFSHLDVVVIAQGVFYFVIFRFHHFKIYFYKFRSESFFFNNDL